jgi:predicted Zn finger-like uncharacterized protein
MVYGGESIEVACKQCGSVFRLLRHQLAMRDKDSVDCTVCGATLLSWNGGEMYSGRQLLKAKSWPRIDDSN